MDILDQHCIDHTLMNKMINKIIIWYLESQGKVVELMNYWWSSTIIKTAYLVGVTKVSMVCVHSSTT